MTGWDFALWGLLGGFAVEALEFNRAIRASGGWPWRQKDEPEPLPMAMAVLARLAISAVVAAATGLSGQVTGQFGAFLAGVTAPLLIDELGRSIGSDKGNLGDPPSLGDGS
jgi:hypothetical protein